MLAVELSEIHAYPLRPEGFEEPLFATAASKRAVAEHLLKAPWLSRASELQRGTGESAHMFEEPIEVRGSCGRVEIVRSPSNGGCSRRRERVVDVLDRWREIREWWNEEGHVDKVVFRVLLSSGGVIDVARKHTGDWLLSGVLD